MRTMGLESLKAQEKLLKIGYNELPSQKKESYFTMFWKIFTEPMLLLLLSAGTVYMFLGELRDALVLLASVFIVIGITFYQEHKTEKTLETLRGLSSPRALVIRDGKHQRIPGRELVEEDIIVLHEGDRVPADAAIISCENFLVDESLLTGESISVRKSVWDGKMQKQRAGGEDLPFVFSGSMVVSGHAIAKVWATGIRTEIGKIGKSLENIKEEETLIHKETSKIVKAVAFIVFILCIVVFLAYFFIKGNATQGLLSGLTLAMAILPEEFPVVLVIFLTLGAWRISKRNVLTRRAAAIETLGAATILCTDKTGTLTQNKMRLQTLYAENSFFEFKKVEVLKLDDRFHNLLEYAILASEQNSFDPIEKELAEKGSSYLTSRERTDEQALIKEYPLSKKLLAQSHVWQLPGQTKLLVAAKGAPEAILEICRLENEEKQKILEVVQKMSERGLRVLGVAKTNLDKENLPEDQNQLDFNFLGLLGFIDPARPNVENSVREAYGAGIRIIMITGDYPGTAQFLAKQIGIKNHELFLTGEDLERMNELELQEKIKKINIFARVAPEQKLLIIDALKANGEIVAMTGDGVNDAPALKAAHIGIAMGERGTDVAREASSLVLLDDDFSSIVAAVRLGRRIYDNLKRAMGYILAVHVPIAGMSILPIFFNLPAVLLPVHIVFLELIIDPACSTVFESQKEDENIMQRRPRNLNQPMFNRRTVLVSLVQGLGALAAIFLLFFFAYGNKSETEARALAFISVVFSSVFLILVNLSWHKNLVHILISGSKALYVVLGGAVLAVTAILYIPKLSNIFHMAPLGPLDLILAVITVALSLFWFEAIKLYRHLAHTHA